MARLPQPGGDAGTWGDILNEYLSQSHTDDGSLKTDTVGAPQLRQNAVTNAAIADGAIQQSKIASLTNDLASKADTSTLNAKADDSAVVHRTGDETIAGAKSFTEAIKVGGADVVTNGDTRLTDSRVPTDGSVTTTKLADGAVTKAKITGVGAADGIATLDANARLSESQVPERLSEAELDATFGADALANPESDLNSAAIALIGSTIGSSSTIPQLNDARGNSAKARIGSGPQFWLIDVTQADPVHVADGDVILPVSTEAVPWTPSMIPGLAGWFDAQSLGLADAAAVASWPNLASGGAAAVQATSDARPVVSITKINGHPAVVADGTDDTLAFSVTPYTGPVSVYIVGGTDLADNTTGSDMLLSAVDSANTTNKFDLYRTTTEAYTLARGTAIASAAAAWTTGVKLIRVIGNGATSSIYQNGTSVASGTVQSSHEVAKWTMFSRAAGAFFPGFIGEILIVHGTLSTEDNAALVSYLETRWGL